MVAVTTRLEIYGRYAPSTSRSRNMLQEQRVERSIDRAPSETRDLALRDGLASPARQGSLGCPQWGGAFGVGAADIASVVGGVVATLVGPSVRVDCLTRAEGLVGAAAEHRREEIGALGVSRFQLEPPHVEHLSLGLPRPGRRRDPRLRGAARVGAQR